ncbi:MAG: hypothetical protein ACLPJJ_04315, partial [Acidocella sp.]
MTYALSGRLRLLTSVALVLTLSGCMMGPNFQAPHPAVPPSYTQEAPAGARPYVSGDAVDPQ